MLPKNRHCCLNLVTLYVCVVAIHRLRMPALEPSIALGAGDEESLC